MCAPSGFRDIFFSNSDYSETASVDGACATIEWRLRQLPYSGGTLRSKRTSTATAWTSEKGLTIAAQIGILWYRRTDGV